MFKSDPYLGAPVPKLVGHLWVIGYPDTGAADLASRITFVPSTQSDPPAPGDLVVHEQWASIFETPWASGDLKLVAMKMCTRFAERLGWPDR